MSLDEKFSDKKLDHGEPEAHVTQKQVDEAAALAGSDIVIDPAEAKRVKRKIDWHLLPLMCRECFVRPMFVRPSEQLGRSSLLGAIYGQGRFR